MNTPLPFIWDGEAMRPLGNAGAACDERFIIGQRYPLQVAEQRSQRSHDHYFACVHDAWQNLPEEVADHFPSAEYLRKYALCRTGYATSLTIPCDSIMAARKVLQEFRRMDAFAVVDRSEASVTVWTAQSQSMKAMGKERFQKSKDAVLGYIAERLGVQPEQLGRAA